jgi:5'(3')-deoxyribonucleotidase
MTKKILYIDMDNVLVDFQSGIDRMSLQLQTEFETRLDEVPGIFGLMKPIPGAIEAFKQLSFKFDTYILSTAPWENPSAWYDKLIWVKKNLGAVAYKRLILTHHKNLLRGDFLVDDRPNNGADEFEGKWIHFGNEEFPNWKVVEKYLGRLEQ